MRAAVTVADLLQAVEALDAAPLARFLDALAGSEVISQSGWRVHEQRVYGERDPQRNAAIRAARGRGLSYGRIAKLFGMKRGQLLRSSGAAKKWCLRTTVVHRGR